MMLVTPWDQLSPHCLEKQARVIALTTRSLYSKPWECSGTYFGSSGSESDDTGYSFPVQHWENAGSGAGNRRGTLKVLVTKWVPKCKQCWTQLVPKLRPAWDHYTCHIYMLALFTSWTSLFWSLHLWWMLQVLYLNLLLPSASIHSRFLEAVFFCRTKEGYRATSMVINIQGNRSHSSLRAKKLAAINAKLASIWQHIKIHIHTIASNKIHILQTSITHSNM